MAACIASDFRILQCWRSQVLDRAAQHWSFFLTLLIKWPTVHPDTYPPLLAAPHPPTPSTAESHSTDPDTQAQTAPPLHPTPPTSGQSLSLSLLPLRYSALCLPRPPCSQGYRAKECSQIHAYQGPQNGT